MQRKAAEIVATLAAAGFGAGDHQSSIGSGSDAQRQSGIDEFARCDDRDARLAWKLRRPGGVTCRSGGGRFTGKKRHYQVAFGASINLETDRR